MGTKRRGQSGLSLIEVVITMGITMGLILAVMSAIQNANQAVKSSSLSNDWVTLLAGIRETYSDARQCGLQFAGYSYPGASLAGGTQLWSFPALVIKNPNGTVASTFLSTTQVVNNFKAANIDVLVSLGNQTQTILVGGTNRYLDHVELNIVADKVQLDGTTKVMGGVTRLQSNSVRNNALRFTIMRDLAGNVVGCYGQDDAAEQACNELGGAYGPPGSSPRCQLPRIFFGSNTQLAPPSAPIQNQGQRVQLWAYTGHGTQDPNDYAIGMDSGTMWFNAGESTGNKFLFTNNAGNNSVASIGPGGVTINTTGGNTPHALFGAIGVGNAWAWYNNSTPAVDLSASNGYSGVGFWNVYGMDMTCGANAWLLSYSCDCYCTDSPNCKARSGRTAFNTVKCGCYGPGTMMAKTDFVCADY